MSSSSPSDSRSGSATTASASAFADRSPLQRSPRSWGALAGFIGLVVVVSAVGGWITSTSVTSWYPTLNRPSWNPPNWIFGPMWTALYAMMAFAAWRLWRVRATIPAARTLLVLWFVQLGLNCAWSFLFFGLRSPTSGLIDIVPLLAVLIGMGVRLWSVDRLVATLWIPYVLWVSFATALNTSIWLRN